MVLGEEKKYIIQDKKICFVIYHDGGGIAGWTLSQWLNDKVYSEWKTRLQRKKWTFIAFTSACPCTSPCVIPWHHLVLIFQAYPIKMKDLLW